MISIIVFTVFAVVVIYGVIDLRKSKFSEQQKNLILVIVGILLSISLLVSNLKETRHFTFSLLKTNLNQVERKFTELPQYSYKYNIPISNQFNQQYYTVNYPHYNDINLQRREKVIFVSNKNQGASSFLFELTKKLQNKRIPVFYFKLNIDVYDQIQLLEEIDVPSLELLGKVIEAWNEKAVIPYLIIDGLEHLTNCRKFLAYLANIFQRMNLNFVGNTQNKRIIERLFRVFPYQRFIIKQWTPPSHQLLYKILPNTYFKRLPSNFHTLSMIQTSSEEEILMKYSNNNKQSIHQLGVQDLIKEIPNKGIALSKIKSRISVDALNQAIQQGIFKIRNGVVYAINS